MNAHRFEELLLAWEENRLTADELKELKQLLAAEPSARQRLVAAGVLENMENITASRAQAWAEIEPIQKTELRAGARRPDWSPSWWFGWRPLSAAAVGLMVGFLCATMVWGLAANRRSLPFEPAVGLMQESFEHGGIPSDRGFPRALETWSGDLAQVVGREADTQPKEGTHMLRLGPASGDLFSRVYYVLDLERHPLPAGVPQMELQASFRPAAPERKSRYILRAAAFSNQPAEIEPRWMNDLWSEIDEHALAYAARGFTVLPRAEAWQTGSLTIHVPPGSRILAIALGAATMDKPQNRGAHFLDDVRLTAVIRETTR